MKVPNTGKESSADTGNKIQRPTITTRRNLCSIALHRFDMEFYTTQKREIAFSFVHIQKIASPIHYTRGFDI